MYTDFLRTEGYLPELELDEQVVFKKGNRFYVMVVAEDADYFQIIVPGFWPIENEAERVQARVAAHAANAETKVAKIYFYEDDTWASVQLFCIPPESFKPVFGRCISALEHAVETFVKNMRG